MVKFLIFFFLFEKFLKKLKNESNKEIIYLIEGILESGNTLNLRYKMIADKHSIGGIAGNRTTLIVIPICASTGLIMPKTSSKAITSATGTADVIETIARIEFSIKELENILKKTKLKKIKIF